MLVLSEIAHVPTAVWRYELANFTGLRLYKLSRLKSKLGGRRNIHPTPLDTCVGSAQKEVSGFFDNAWYGYVQPAIQCPTERADYANPTVAGLTFTPQRLFLAAPITPPPLRTTLDDTEHKN